MTYRMYLESDLNRVFTQSLGPIAAAELGAVLSHQLDARDTSIELVDEGRASYLAFTFDGDREALARRVAKLSATAALFQEHSASSLEPIPLVDDLTFSTEVVTGQRYKGKTSERLTRLMLNLATAVADVADEDGWSLLDPMCGRGTTLNWALLYGGRSTGLDVDRRALDDYATFLAQWAKKCRLPHKMQRYKKQNSESRHFDFTVARDRATLAAKSKPDIRTLHAPADDASVPVGTHSMLVSDLPYGIQHQARSATTDAPTSMSDLVGNVLGRCAPALRSGGSLALSWNVRSLGRPDMVDQLVDAGCECVDIGGFEHRVDRTIQRDVIVARRITDDRTAPQR